jgi:hypothetical protein
MPCTNSYFYALAPNQSQNVDLASINKILLGLKSVKQKSRIGCILLVLGKLHCYKMLFESSDSYSLRFREFECISFLIDSALVLPLNFFIYSINSAVSSKHLTNLNDLFLVTYFLANSCDFSISSVSASFPWNTYTILESGSIKMKQSKLFKNFGLKSLISENITY